MPPVYLIFTVTFGAPGELTGTRDKYNGLSKKRAISRLARTLREAVINGFMIFWMNDQRHLRAGVAPVPGCLINFSDLTAAVKGPTTKLVCAFTTLSRKHT